MTITLATLPTATAQQVFDHVAKHLLTQNHKSGTDVMCLYRDDQGRSCAVGSCISDEEYELLQKKEFKKFTAVQTGIESLSWNNLSEQLCLPSHEELISALQGIHDDYGVNEWLLELHEFSRDYDLSADVLKSFLSPYAVHPEG